MTNSDGPFVKVSRYGVHTVGQENLKTECSADYWDVKVEHGDRGSEKSGGLGTRQWLHFRLKNWHPHGADIALELPNLPGLAGL